MKSDITELRKIQSEIENLKDRFIIGSGYNSLESEAEAKLTGLITKIRSLLKRFEDGENYLQDFNVIYQTEQGGYPLGPTQLCLDKFTNHMESVIEIETQKMETNLRNSKNVKDNYVDTELINKLKIIEAGNYDLTKLIRLLEELNIAHQNECFFSIGMLVRAVIDHIPPFFNFRNFQEFANQYQCNKSFKDLMKHLNDVSKKVADDYLHKQINQREIQPSFTQVNFATNIDFLLKEIINNLEN